MVRPSFARTLLTSPDYLIVQAAREIQRVDAENRAAHILVRGERISEDQGQSIHEDSKQQIKDIQGRLRRELDAVPLARR